MSVAEIFNHANITPCRMCLAQQQQAASGDDTNQNQPPLHLPAAMQGRSRVLFLLASAVSGISVQNWVEGSVHHEAGSGSAAGGSASKQPAPSRPRSPLSMRRIGRARSAAPYSASSCTGMCAGQNSSACHRHAPKLKREGSASDSMKRSNGHLVALAGMLMRTPQ